MKRRVHARKFLAWTLCLVMLACLAMPVLATGEDAPPAAAPAEAAPAVKTEAPPAKAEAPAVKDDAPAAKAETPAEKAEVPAVKDEAPAEKAEVPAVKAETPVEKDETPAGKEDAPAAKGTEAPAQGSKAPVKASEAPVEASVAPVKASEAPVDATETPASASEAPESAAPAEDEIEEEELGVATLFSVGRPSADGGDFVIDWDSEDLQDSGWDSKHGVVQADGGFYLYFEIGQWSSASLGVCTTDPWNPVMSFSSNANDRSHLYNGGSVWGRGVEVRHYDSNGRAYVEAYVPAELITEENFTFRCNNATFDISSGIDHHGEDANGFAVDWSEVEFITIDQWNPNNTVAVVQGDGGYYFCFRTDPWSGGADIALYYADEPGAKADQISFYAWNTSAVTGLNGRVHSDATLKSQEADGARYTEIYFPAEHFDSYDFTLMLGQGVFLESDEIPLKPGQSKSDLPASNKPEPVYSGIAIDGSFHDWDAVPKVEVDDFQDGYALDEVALVWDGDYIYIYLAENGERQPYGTVIGDWRGVVAAGPHSNGQFAITTDLGRTLLIQPVVNSNEPAVAGVDGAKAAVNNKDNNSAPHRWELAIPTSALPEYLETFSFGFYMVEPFITDVSNMQDTPGAVDPFKANVVIDGKYNDWVGYPHALIEYDTSGIQHHKVDGEGALWSNDGVLYGHVVTEHPDHLAEQGSCFLAAISIAFNGDRDFKAWPQDGNFYPRILAIDADGSITDYYLTVNEGHSTPNGTYTYYIFDTRTDPIKQFGHMDEDGITWHDATAADLIENAFGVMKVTVTGTKDEAEFELYLDKVADYIGQDANTAFKTIDIQWGRIGQQWITCAGTPTGPVLGVALAVGAIGAPMCYTEVKKRRGAKKAKSDTEVK